MNSRDRVLYIYTSVQFKKKPEYEIQSEKQTSVLRKNWHKKLQNDIVIVGYFYEQSTTKYSKDF